MPMYNFDPGEEEEDDWETELLEECYSNHQRRVRIIINCPINVNYRVKYVSNITLLFIARISIYGHRRKC